MTSQEILGQKQHAFLPDKNEDTFVRIATVILGLQRVCMNVLEELAKMGPHPEETELGNGDKSNLGHIV